MRADSHLALLLVWMSGLDPEVQRLLQRVLLLLLKGQLLQFVVGVQKRVGLPGSVLVHIAVE